MDFVLPTITLFTSAAEAKIWNVIVLSHSLRTNMLEMISAGVSLSSAYFAVVAQYALQLMDNGSPLIADLSNGLYYAYSDE